jgi:putative iron-regulated protein
MKLVSLFLVILGLLTTGSRAAEMASGELARAVVLHHAKIIHATYEDSLLEAKRMKSSVEKMVVTPTEATLQAAREAWIAARRPYLQTEAFRYYAGPIDDADGPEPSLNSWPMDESYLDRVPGGIGDGLIGNEKLLPKITPDAIEALNQVEGETNVACGWHAIEFLLWGQDTSATGPGARPATDFTTGPHASRRGAYLNACVDLLVEHLEDLARQWEPENINNYRAVFEEGVAFSVERILMGLIFLSGNEMAGERLQAAWDSREQEEEHSCFSDTTHLDTVWDVIGIQNVWHGTYARLDGTSLAGKGLRDLATAADPKLAAELEAQITQSVVKAKAVPAPFDQAILGDNQSPGRKAVMAIIASVEDQAAMLRRLARALGFEIPEEAPGDIEG